MSALQWTLVSLLLVGAPRARAQPGEGPLALDAVLHGGFPVGGDARGVSVASSGEGRRVIVGAVHGGARIFVHDESGWQLEHEIRTDALHTRTEVSVAMAADGSRVLVGEPGTREGGAVAVYVRSGSTWRHEAELHASDVARGDRFGAAVALSADGSRALVGVPGDDVGQDDAGSARVFVRTNDVWSEEGRLVAPDRARGDTLGAAVALSADGSLALVGAPRDDVEQANDAGSVRVFAREALAWIPIDLVRAEDFQPGDGFGATLALSAEGDLAVIGAPFDDIDDVTNAGSVHVVRRLGRVWRTEAVITESGRTRRLGVAVAIAGDGSLGLVAGIADGACTGWVLARGTRGWRLTRAFHAPSIGPRGALALSTDGSHVVVGATSDTIDDVPRAGSARVYRFADDANAWAATPDHRVAPRFPHGVLEGRTPAQEREIADAWHGLLVVGAILAASGIALTTLSIAFGIERPSSDLTHTADALVIGGISLLGAGVLSIVASGIVLSQATRGGLRPQLVLAPGGVMLRF